MQYGDLQDTATGTVLHTAYTTMIPGSTIPGIMIHGTTVPGIILHHTTMIPIITVAIITEATMPLLTTAMAYLPEL